MVHSSLIGDSADLVSVSQGGRTIRAPERSDAVERIQQALVCVGGVLPQFGIDGGFGNETGIAVSAFKTNRGISPNDPVVGRQTIARLDLELTYLENWEDLVVDDVQNEPRILASDPLFGGILDHLNPDRGIPDKILQFFELSNELCFPMSALVGPLVSSLLGRLVEPKVANDYCSLHTPCTSADFFDVVNSPAPYTDFLRAHNPQVPESTIVSIGASVRPDILRHRPGSQEEWYEIKPMSPSGMAEWLVKAKQLRDNYQPEGRPRFPYKPGKSYTPSRELLLGRFVTPEGESLEVFIEPRRPVPGMILYRICVRGDYVAYFNRVRLIAGILAILAALAPELLAAGTEAAEAGAFMEALTSLAARFNVIIPVLLRAP